jgi:hypothetical protein
MVSTISLLMVDFSGYQHLMPFPASPVLSLAELAHAVID